MRTEQISLLKADPDLGALLAEPRRAEAERRLLVSTHRLAVGPWDVTRLSGASADHIGLLVLDGVVARELIVADHVSAELLGPGDLVRPWQPASRTGLLIFLREVPTGPSDPVSHFWGELEDGLERHFRDKPVGIAWGMKDAAFTPAVLDELWLGTFPHAVVTRVPDAGHFVQEDAYERVVPVLLDHLRNAPPRSGPRPRSGGID